MNRSLQQQRQRLQQEVSKMQADWQDQFLTGQRGGASIATYLNTTIENTQRRIREIEEENKSLQETVRNLRSEYDVREPSFCFSLKFER